MRAAVLFCAMAALLCVVLPAAAGQGMLPGLAALDRMKPVATLPQSELSDTKQQPSKAIVRPAPTPAATVVTLPPPVATTTPRPRQCKTRTPTQAGSLSKMATQVQLILASLKAIQADIEEMRKTRKE